MDERLVMGLSMSLKSRTVHAALLRVFHAGVGCQLDMLGWSALPVPPSAAEAGTTRRAVTPGDAVPLCRVLIDAVQAAVARAGVPLEQVLLTGLMLDEESEEAAGMTQAPAVLAEVTGTTVVGGFAARDRASGGRGKLLTSLVDWMLAHAGDRSRIVLHLDWSTTLTYLPAGGGPDTVRAFEAGPGIGLLDAFVGALTRGAESSDARGMLSVQGRQIKPLVRRWAAHPFLRLEPPKQLSPDDFGDTFIAETIDVAAERSWSLTDVLCTATHFVAACPADATRRFLGTDSALREVLLVGPGAHNGFLLRLLEEQFRGIGLATAAIARIPVETYEAVAAALLATLALDGIESNLPSVTGAAGPRLLGQFTPGCAANWRACTDWLTRSANVRKLRAA